VAEAFGIAPEARAALVRDVSPTAFRAAGVPKVLIAMAVIIVAVALLSQCGQDECAEFKRSFGEASAEYRQCRANRATGARTVGGSYGGWSSGGGGHK
jgi:hypothetical protein